MAMKKPGPPHKLSPKLRHAALLEARGELSGVEIAKRVNLTKEYLYRMKSENPSYKLLVESHQKELVNRHYDASAMLQKKFDDEAPSAFETVAQLHKRADRDTTRLGAAKEILDRSSIAPAKIVGRESGEGGVTIQIATKKLEQIFGALEDVGDIETIQLLEGEYEEST
jgi:hypothetical protein